MLEENPIGCYFYLKSGRKHMTIFLICYYNY
jgi:hypothetical protein